VIEGGDAIGRDEQQRLADSIEVADFAAREQRKIAQIGLRECVQGGLLPSTEGMCEGMAYVPILGAGLGFVNAERFLLTIQRKLEYL
jgi:hypothetical protein